MRILLTGGAGFIGTHVADAIRTAGDEVVTFDRVRVADDPRSIVGDVTDLAAVTAALDGVDAVCHQAAKVGLGVDFGDAVGYVSDNDLGTAT
ncbi:MAG: NAD(P)-dependent oxidoreductase, partial [Acidimicrobiia bacterium]